MAKRKPSEQALMAWIQHYRQALKYIRHIEVPFTPAWRICQRTLQSAPKELVKAPQRKSKQLELFQ